MISKAENIIYYFEDNTPVRCMVLKDVPDNAMNQIKKGKLLVIEIEHGIHYKYIPRTTDNRKKFDEIFEKAKISDYLSDINNWQELEYWQLKAIYEILKDERAGTENFSDNMQITRGGC